LRHRAKPIVHGFGISAWRTSFRQNEKGYRLIPQADWEPLTGDQNVCNSNHETEKEIEDSQMLPRGEYAFHIIEAKETKSLAGNDMIELKVRVTKNGYARILPDYILPQRPAKFRNICIACGVEDKYLSGTVSDDDFLGKRGKVKVGIERAKKGYPPPNVIVDYIFRKEFMTEAEEIQLMHEAEILIKENRKLRDEIRKLKPMARLATGISLMEGENARIHKDLLERDRHWDDLKVLYKNLEARVAAWEGAAHGSSSHQAEGRPLNAPRSHSVRFTQLERGCLTP
jgi:hypothetical protein